MQRKDIVNILRSLHEDVSIGELLHCLSILCDIRSMQEDEDDNAEASALYLRAAHLIDALDHVSI
jgi:hypothetical protein